jgi:hypothetical protein
MFAAITNYTLFTTSKLYSQGVPTSLEEELYSLESSYVTAYRGCKTHRLLGEIDGNIWTPKGVCSATKRVDIAKLFARERFPQRASLLIIMGRARDVEKISAHPREEEVLFYRQQFTIRYLGRRQDLDIWGAIEVGLTFNPAEKPAQEYPFPTMEECQGYVHKPTYSPKPKWVDNLSSNPPKKVKELNPGDDFSLYHWTVVDKLSAWAKNIGNVEVYQHKKGKEIWVGYQGKEYNWGITDYYLQKDDCIIHLRVDWNEEKYDKYSYSKEDVFI